MLLQYTPDEHTALDWDKKTKTFTIEVSSIPRSELNKCSFSTCIDIHIPASNNTKQFAYVGVIRDRDNDVMFWEYRTHDNFALKIFND